MTPALAAVLSMLVTAYLAVGLAWAVIVAVTRLFMDEPVTWSGFALQGLFWPVAFWLSVRGAK